MALVSSDEIIYIRGQPYRLHATRYGARYRSYQASKGKRQPPPPEEQARRVAWGKTWGAINSRTAKRLREDQDTNE